MDSPVFVDFHFRLKTKKQLVGIFLRAVAVVVVAFAAVGIAQIAFPFHHIRVFFEFGDSYAEIVQFVPKLRRKFIHKSLIRAFGIFRHSFSHHLRHFVARNVAVAPKTSVAVTVDNAVASKLSNSVISPMPRRNIGKGICCGKRNACRASSQKRCDNCFLHYESS